MSRAVAIPHGSWPLEMRAETAAAYCDEPSVEAFLSKVAKGNGEPRSEVNTKGDLGSCDCVQPKERPTGVVGDAPSAAPLSISQVNQVEHIGHRGVPSARSRTKFLER